MKFIKQTKTNPTTLFVTLRLLSSKTNVEASS